MTLVGVKVQVAPAGLQLVTERATALLYPWRDVAVTVELAGLPWVMVTEDGLAESEKLGGVVTVSPTDVVWSPELPEIVGGARVPVRRRSADIGGHCQHRGDRSVCEAA